MRSAREVRRAVGQARGSPSVGLQAWGADGGIPAVFRALHAGHAQTTRAPISPVASHRRPRYRRPRYPGHEYPGHEYRRRRCRRAAAACTAPRAQMRYVRMLCARPVRVRAAPHANAHNWAARTRTPTSELPHGKARVRTVCASVPHRCHCLRTAQEAGVAGVNARTRRAEVSGGWAGQRGRNWRVPRVSAAAEGRVSAAEQRGCARRCARAAAGGPGERRPLAPGCGGRGL